MAYKVADRAKEWTTYAGILVAGIATVVPQLVPTATWVQVWADAQMLLGAALMFLPQTAGTLAVENEILPLLQALSTKIPPQYGAAMQPFLAILAKVAMQPTTAAPAAVLPGVLIAPPPPVTTTVTDPTITVDPAAVVAGAVVTQAVVAP